MAEPKIADSRTDADRARQILREDPDELMALIAGRLRELGVQDESDPILAYIGALQEQARANVSGDDDSDSNDLNSNSATAAFQSTLTAIRKQAPGRHDGKRAPAGYVLKGPWLVRILNFNADEDAAAIAMNLMVNMAAMFHVREEKGPEKQLISAIMPQLRHSTPNGEMINRNAEWLKKSHEDWAIRTGLAREVRNGKRRIVVGRETWETVLEAQLQMDAVHREQAAIAEKMGVSVPSVPRTPLFAPDGTEQPESPTGSFDGPASGAEILACMASMGIKVPDRLTAQVIEEMRSQVGVNAGGPNKKKTARAAVNLLAEKLETSARGEK